MKSLRHPGWQGLAGRAPWFRGLTVLLLVLMVVVAGYFIRIRAPSQAYAEAVALERRGLQVLEAREGLIADLEVERQVLAQTEQHLGMERWRLDAGEGMSELLDELAMSGHEHGLLFERLDVLDGRQVSGYRLIPLELRVRGHYPALRAWLEQWLRRLRLLSVSRFELAMHAESGLLVAQVQLHAYQSDEALPVPQALADKPARVSIAPGTFDPFRAWSFQRAEDGLARVPLEQLEMVGSLSRGGRHEALLRSGGRIYRVAAGARLGRDDGVVEAIDAGQVTVRERIYIGGGWQERQRFLALAKSAPREVGYEAGMQAGRGGNDTAAGHAGGAGGRTSQ